MYKKKFEKIIDEMTVEELVGQTMCVSFPGKIMDEDAVFENFRNMHIGGLFIISHTPEETKRLIDKANAVADLPLIVASDIEHGAGNGIVGEPSFPCSMAWGACNDPELIEKAGEMTAKICRTHGINYNFGPIVDLNTNPDNPESNIRSISDDPTE